MILLPICKDCRPVDLMLTPPSIKKVLYFPVTSATGIFAIAVTAMWWGGWPVETVATNGRVWEKWPARWPRTGRRHKCPMLTMECARRRKN